MARSFPCSSAVRLKPTEPTLLLLPALEVMQM